jgi:hypothetical protein
MLPSDKSVNIMKTIFSRFHLIGLAALVSLTLRAQTVTFTTNTAIGVGNTNYDSAAIVVTNCTVTMDGPHTFASLLVAGGGTLTHSYSSSGSLSNVLSVVDESQVLNDTNPVTLLNSNVVIASVVVTDAGSTIVYTNGVDYLLTSLTNGLTQLQRTTDSSIPDGTNVLVSYDAVLWVVPAGLNLTLTGDVDVAIGGSINANGTGYGGGNGPGSGNSAGSPQDGSGGGYGGNGGMSSSNAVGGVTYGSFVQPTDLGSGGGVSYAGVGGAGGGAIQIVTAGNVIINGLITANGDNGTNSRSGGGAGGSVWITASSVSGSGAITANGGAGEPIHGGGGGGGCIAIQCGVNSFAGSMAAYGGAGATAGGAGTVYTVLTAQNGLLVMDNGGLAGANSSVAITSGVDVLIRNKAGVIPSGSWSIGNLTISSNSLLVAASQSTVNLTATGDVTIQSSGSLVADSAGYPAGTGNGSGRNYYYTDGYPCGGGGHGGSGANGSSANATGGTTYDSQSSPTAYGSGGGNYAPYSTGGAGGGAIQLNVSGVLQVDGRISANGGNGSGTGGGGGAGGSIWITSGLLVGSGTIAANGGNGEDSIGGGGGGGRIAIYPTTDLFSGAISAYGGGGANWGGAGTLYIQPTGQNGQLTVDNGGHPGTNTLLQSAGSAALTVCNGAIGVASGSVSFANLILSSNAWLGAYYNSFLPANTVNFSFSGNATIQAGCGIKTDAAGYAAGQGTGAGSFYNSFNYPCGGGGHGGYGANSVLNIAPGGRTYDSTTAPSDPGSGGGTYSSYSTGGAGGGVIRVTVSGALEMDGTISANGGNGSGDGGGGGSGGSIWLTVGMLSGAGTITVNGGSGVDSTGGGGGGGMVYISCANNSYAGAITAYGGGGANWGGAGTILIQPLEQNGQLTLDNGGNSGASTPLQSASSTVLTVGNGAAGLISSSVSFASLLVNSNGWLVTASNSSSSYTLTMSSATIQAGGGIIADGMGYLAGQGPGEGHNWGGPNFPCSGAGHGGYGANSAFNYAAGGGVYDSTTSPNIAGSGGGTYNPYSTGGAGGGALKLVVSGTLQVSGKISANGGNGSGDGGGGGSGGSIWLSVGTLSGSGSITANGGSGAESVGGGGGGGCIAIIPYNNNSFSGAITAYGGGGANWGGAGTVYILPTGQNGQLTLDNGGNSGASTPLQSSSSTVLTVGDGAAGLISSSVSFASLLVNSNGWLVTATNSSSSYTLTLSSATIQAGGGIIADGMGYAAGQGPGEGYYYSSPNNPCSGAGHGGYGAYGVTNGGSSGGVYDSITSPTIAGSGGGTDSPYSTGGAGGGALKLVVSGTLQVSGKISANGGNGSGDGGGGGSGGSIWLAVGTLSGSGSITANGGSGAESVGGGGGGGIICISCATDSFSGAITAYGGGGANWGGAGTVFVQPTGQNGQLTLDNGGNSGANTPVQSASSSSTSLTVGNGAAGLISNSLNFASLLVNSNGWLVAATNSSSSYTWTLSSATIQAGGGIIADAMGYAAGQGSGEGHSGQSYWCSGAGHGGYGANSAGNNALGGGVYDNTTSPNAVGSGGGTFSSYSTGGAGGGALKLVVSGTLQVSGKISANGGNGSGIGGGGGSGGSIYLAVGALSGAGTITANGGNGVDSVGGGGGGGMIYISCATNSYAGAITAYGGGGANWGGVGTVFIQPTGQNGQLSQLTLDNGGNPGTNTPLQSVSSSSTALTVGNGAAGLISGSLTFASLIVNSNGWLVTKPNSSSSYTLTLSSATIQAGGGIIADAMGYAAGQGNGEGHNYSSPNNYPCSGAGHGGYGANSADNYAVGGGVYDSTTSPNAAGSGGGTFSSYSTGGAGGGALKLVVNGTLQVSGKISANGGNGSGDGGGGGSGGSIWLSVGTLSGAGSITANGGSGADSVGGGGGGGCIAITYNNNSFSGAITAYGGGGANWGGAGTIFLKPSQGGYGQLTLDNGGNAGTNSSFNASSTDLILADGAVGQLPYSGWSVRNLQISSNSMLKTAASGSSQTLNVTGNATIEAGGALSVAGAGYSAESGPGAGGYTYFNGSSFISGGGHGGYGAANGLGYGGTYDSIQSPVNAGSGGGNWGGSYGYGGAGGGALRLAVTGTLIVDGKISADGAGGGENSGGGSGGSLWITAGTITGSGVISANGGLGNSLGGGGGGGRIALGYNANVFDGLISAYGGGGYEQGGAGTIYTKANNQSVGQVLVDNGGVPGTNTPLSTTYGMPSSASLTVGNGAVASWNTPSLVLSNLTVASGGTLTSVSPQTNLDLIVLNNVIVSAGGAIAVDGNGFSQGNGPGAGESVNELGSGAGYGGVGGASATAPGGAIYGSAQQPVAQGSGGGFGWGTPFGGSEGGGAIRLNVGGTLVVDGQLSANGDPGLQDNSGGGSGGSIWVTAGTLAGDGQITANGGEGELYGGGGGAGGRIALYSHANIFGGTVSAAGADGETWGAAGSIVYSNSFTLQVLSQTPTGIVNNGVSSVELVFNEAPNPASFSVADVSLMTPNGALPSSAFTMSALNSSCWLVSFPQQTAIGGYTLTVGTNITDLYGQPMSQVYTGAFTISLPVIHGNVTDTNGQPVAGVLLQPDDGLSPTTTDTNGNYALGVIPGSSFTVVPAQSGLLFVPGSISYTNVTASISNQDYVAVTTVIQGAVTDTNGQPVAGVLLQSYGGLSSTTTDTNGNYVLGLIPGTSFTVVPSQSGLMFVPGSISYTNATTSISNQNYLAVTTIAATVAAGLQTTNFGLGWYGISGVNYQVYSSTNLMNWVPYGVPITGSNSVIQLTVPVGNQPQMFFQVQSGN